MAAFTAAALAAEDGADGAGLLAVTVGATRRATPVVGTPAVERAAAKVAPPPLLMLVIWVLTAADDVDGAVTVKATLMLPVSR